MYCARGGCLLDGRGWNMGGGGITQARPRVRDEAVSWGRGGLKGGRRKSETHVSKNSPGCNEEHSWDT